jgi:hypothetical protein
LKAFTFTAKQLFDTRDSAKLKNEKSLDAGGAYLAGNKFGFAVVVVSTGMEGDDQKDLVLTQARAMVVREYLVNNFGFDDSQLKTLGVRSRFSSSRQEPRCRLTNLRRQRTHRLPMRRSRHRLPQRELKNRNASRAGSNERQQLAARRFARSAIMEKK